MMSGEIYHIGEKDKFVKYLRFKNNVGYDKSIMEGYKVCTSEAAIVIDCDLQDPVELIRFLFLSGKKAMI